MRPYRLSRRSFLVGSTAAASASMMLSLSAQRVFGAEVAKELRWYTWGTYYKPEYFEGFTEKSGIELTVGSISSNDQQYAMLKAGGTRDWDVFDTENASTPLYIKDGLVKPLDYSRIPNASMLFPSLQKPEWCVGPDGQTYFIVHIFGIDTIAYRSDLVEEPPTSWAALFDEKYAGKITFQDYALDAINMAGLVLYGRTPSEGGYSAWTDAQLEEIKKKLIDQKKLVRTYWATEADARNLFVNGEVVIGETWVPTAYALRAEGLKVELALPKEGPWGWSDNFGISKDADEAATNAAYEMINFALGPDYGLKINRDAPYTTSTTNGWLDKLTEAEKKVLFLDQVQIFDTFNYRKLPPNYDKWTQLWDEVKIS
jgi:spermidine/putrescine transport system substrate-binding protein